MHLRRLLAPMIGVMLAAPPAPAAPQERPSPPVPQGSSIPAGRPQVAPPLPGGSAPDLDLVVTAQVAGWIEPCG